MNKIDLKHAAGLEQIFGMVKRDVMDAEARATTRKIGPLVESALHRVGSILHSHRAVFLRLHGGNVHYTRRRGETSQLLLFILRWKNKYWYAYQARRISASYNHHAPNQPTTDLTEDYDAIQEATLTYLLRHHNKKRLQHKLSHLIYVEYPYLPKLFPKLKHIIFKSNRAFWPQVIERGRLAIVRPTSRTRYLVDIEKLEILAKRPLDRLFDLRYTLKHKAPTSFTSILKEDFHISPKIARRAARGNANIEELKRELAFGKLQ